MNPNLVFYESSGGAGMICNPFAIFKALVDDPARARLKHIWAVNSSDELELLAREYRTQPNVSFVLRDSERYLKALATAKYIVQNTSYPSYFAKREGQICVNTWHSTTVKMLGYDMPDGNIQSRNVIRSLLMSDYVVSPNSFMTNIFRFSYRLQHIFPGRVLELGYPRNDLTARANRDEVLRKLRERGVTIDPTKKVILYAPTWRGASVSEVNSDASGLAQFYEHLTSEIDNDTYQVLIKPHPFTDRVLSDEDRKSGSYVPRQVDANELLSIVDILVSDYSSVYFDFLTTGRPVLFYIPDKHAYVEERGVYFPFEELPGPVSQHLSDIAEWIGDIDHVSASYVARYEEVRAWACAQEDGNSAARVVRAVFDRHHDEGVIDDFLPRTKKRILFYVSGLGSNGVTSAFNALLDHIDREKYDVTVWGLLQDGASKENFRALQGVRTMARFGSFAITRWEAFGIEYVARYALNGPLVKLFRPEAALERDYRRSFGDAEFDYFIDFSGYGTLFPSIIRQRDAVKKIIWQHNDLAADIGNAEKRKLERYRTVATSIAGLKNTYASFDKVVSCGQHVMEVNRRALATPATEGRFAYVNNLIDSKRVRGMAIAEPAVAVDRHIVANLTFTRGARRVVLLPDFPPHPESGQPYVKFVSIGRLSPEKNHDSLIRGFAQFAQEHPNSRLYVLGGGELQSSLERLAADLGVDDRVAFSGHLKNPFAVARHCDCFILPSKYEGFGLVVPEMRILSKPIVLSRFEAVDSVALPDGQYMIGHEPEDVLKGMKAFVDGEVPADYDFDVDVYNEQAYTQFVKMLESV